MIEILAALVGSGVTIAAMGIGGGIKNNSTNKEVVTRLTVAVENIAEKLEELHVDIKSDRREMFGRLNGLEQRVSKLEAKV